MDTKFDNFQNRAIVVGLKILVFLPCGQNLVERLDPVRDLLAEGLESVFSSWIEKNYGSCLGNGQANLYATN